MIILIRTWLSNDASSIRCTHTHTSTHSSAAHRIWERDYLFSFYSFDSVRVMMGHRHHRNRNAFQFRARECETQGGRWVLFGTQAHIKNNNLTHSNRMELEVNEKWRRGKWNKDKQYTHTHSARRDASRWKQANHKKVKSVKKIKNK